MTKRFGSSLTCKVLIGEIIFEKSVARDSEQVWLRPVTRGMIENANIRISDEQKTAMETRGYLRDVH